MKCCGNNGRIRRNVPPLCHSDRSASGVEESTTLENEPTQDETCHSGRFLDSHSFARNDMSGVVPFCQHRLYLPRSGTAHRPFPTVSLKGSASATVVPTMLAALPLAGGPCLSLWERWPSVARTERVNVEDLGGRYHSKETPQGPLSHLR